jgi:CubicO group peptidase (beta-lactamase class C family)
MWTRQKTSEGRETPYGLGFVPYSRQYGQLLGHGGSQPEAKTELAINPSTRFGIVVMSNCEHCRPTQVAAAVATACGQDFSVLAFR